METSGSHRDYHVRSRSYGLDRNSIQRDGNDRSDYRFGTRWFTLVIDSGTPRERSDGHVESIRNVILARTNYGRNIGDLLDDFRWLVERIWQRRILWDVGVDDVDVWCDFLARVCGVLDECDGIRFDSENFRRDSVRRRVLLPHTYAQTDPA